jgi:hypothetical protein
MKINKTMAKSRKKGLYSAKTYAPHPIHIAERRAGFCGRFAERVVSLIKNCPRRLGNFSAFRQAHHRIDDLIDIRNHCIN